MRLSLPERIDKNIEWLKRDFLNQTATLECDVSEVREKTLNAMERGKPASEKCQKEDKSRHDYKQIAANYTMPFT